MVLYWNESLGLTLTNQLDWNVHIDNNTNKANKTLGLLKWNVQIKNVQLKSFAYNSLVRPHLEYAVPVWDPYTKKNIDKLKMIQRRAARYRYHYSASVTEMLNELGWKSLEERRKAYETHNDVEDNKFASCNQWYKLFNTVSKKK